MQQKHQLNVMKPMDLLSFSLRIFRFSFLLWRLFSRLSLSLSLRVEGVCVGVCVCGKSVFDTCTLHSCAFVMLIHMDRSMNSSPHGARQCAALIWSGTQKWTRGRKKTAATTNSNYIQRMNWPKPNALLILDNNITNRTQRKKNEHDANKNNWNEISANY